LATLQPKAHGSDQRVSDGHVEATDDTLEATERTQSVDARARDEWLKTFGFKTDL
jgi:hypothetical protein